MKIVSFHKDIASLRIESLDDLWYLSSLLEKGDVLEGKTMRKIKLGGGDERSTSAVKRPVYLKIEVEKVEFHKFSNNLRVAGRILEGTDDIPKGSYHTFAIEEDSQIKLQKKEWLSFHKSRLREASKERQPPLLVCVFDRDEALIAIIKQYGYDLLAHLHGTVQKKRDVAQVTSNFYEEIENVLKEHVERFHVRSVLMASPGFWKDELLKNLKDDALKKKLIFATVSSVDKGAINELLGRPEVKSALQQERFAQEVALVNELLSAIGKAGLAAYGLKETAAAAEACAVKLLLITDGFLQKKREQDAFEPVQSLLHTVDKGKGEIRIISSDHDGGKKLDGLGGVAALLRFSIA